MKEMLEQIKARAMQESNEAADMTQLENLRIRLLGKKGELTAVLKQMGKLSAEERPVMGQLANTVRAAIEEKLETRKTELKAKALEMKLKHEAIDVTIPGDKVTMGHKHPRHSTRPKKFLSAWASRSWRGRRSNCPSTISPS